MMCFLGWLPIRGLITYTWAGYLYLGWLLLLGLVTCTWGRKTLCGARVLLAINGCVVQWGLFAEDNPCRKNPRERVPQDPRIGRRDEQEADRHTSNMPRRSKISTKQTRGWRGVQFEEKSAKRQENRLWFLDTVTWRKKRIVERSPHREQSARPLLSRRAVEGGVRMASSRRCVFM